VDLFLIIIATMPEYSLSWLIAYALQ
jgi:enoyl-[acyl-carrier-protein] reductase (NADH)